MSRLAAVLVVACGALMLACPDDPRGEGEGEGEGDAAEGEGEGEGEPAHAALVADPAPHAFAAGTPVAVTLAIDNAQLIEPLTIYFTTDGSAPVPNVSPVFDGTAPIDASAGLELRAVAATSAGNARLTFAGVYLALAGDVATFSSNLPVLVLWTRESLPNDRSDEYTRGTLSVFSPDASGRTAWPRSADLSVRAGMKIRGSSTAGYPKHQWRIETRTAFSAGDEDADLPVALLGMPPDGDWVFGAPLDFDRALLRNTLAFAMSNASGQYAPRTEYAELFIVGDGQPVSTNGYYGLYEITEHIESGDDRVDIAALTPDDILAEDISGGYIFKEDRTGPGEGGFYAGNPGDAFYFQQSFVFVEPDELTITSAQRGYLTGYLDDVGAALASADFTSPASGKHYAELLDSLSFIDHNIINLYTKNPDALRLSGFFYKERDGPLFIGPVWDFDRTMGCSSDSRCDDPTWFDVTQFGGDGTAMFDHGWYRGLFNDPVFRDAYWARMGELMDGPLSMDALDPFIDAQAARIEEAQARNFARWQDYPPRGTWQDEVALVKSWLRTRHDWLVACLQYEDPRTCPGD